MLAHTLLNFIQIYYMCYMLVQHLPSYVARGQRTHTHDRVLLDNQLTQNCSKCAALACICKVKNCVPLAGQAHYLMRNNALNNAAGPYAKTCHVSRQTIALMWRHWQGGGSFYSFRAPVTCVCQLSEAAEIMAI